MSDPTLYPIHVSPFQIRFVDLPRDAVPVRIPSRPRRVATGVSRAAIAILAAATLAFIVYGFANA